MAKGSRKSNKGDAAAGGKKTNHGQKETCVRVWRGPPPTARNSDLWDLARRREESLDKAEQVFSENLSNLKKSSIGKYVAVCETGIIEIVDTHAELLSIILNQKWPPVMGVQIPPVRPRRRNAKERRGDRKSS